MALRKLTFMGKCCPNFFTIMVFFFLSRKTSNKSEVAFRIYRIQQVILAMENLIFYGEMLPKFVCNNLCFFFNNLNQNRPERSVLRKTDLSGLFF